MNAPDLIKKLDKLTKITDYKEKTRELDKFLSYLEGVLNTEHDDFNRLFLTSLYFALQLRLSMGKEINDLDKKIDDLQPNINNILGRVSRLEKRFDDLDKGR